MLILCLTFMSIPCYNMTRFKRGLANKKEPYQCLVAAKKRLKGKIMKKYIAYIAIVIATCVFVALNPLGKLARNQKAAQIEPMTSELNAVEQRPHVEAWRAAAEYFKTNDGVEK